MEIAHARRENVFVRTARSRSCREAFHTFFGEIFIGSSAGISYFQDNNLAF
jgi:hypothetical protein